MCSINQKQNNNNNINDAINKKNWKSKMNYKFVYMPEHGKEFLLSVWNANYARK